MRVIPYINLDAKSSWIYFCKGTGHSLLIEKVSKPKKWISSRIVSQRAQNVLDDISWSIKAKKVFQYPKIKSAQQEHLCARCAYINGIACKNKKRLCNTYFSKIFGCLKCKLVIFSLYCVEYVCEVHGTSWILRI